MEGGGEGERRGGEEEGEGEKREGERYGRNDLTQLAFIVLKNVCLSTEGP